MEAVIVPGQLLTHVANVVDLRTVTPSYDGQQFELLGYTVKGIGGGVVYYDASDITSSDNGVTVFVNGSYRFKRKLGSALSVHSAGALGNGINDDADSILKAIKVAYDSGISNVYFPSGKYIVSKPISIMHKQKWTGDGASTIISPTSTFTGSAVITSTVAVNALWLGYFSISDICIVSNSADFRIRGIELVGAVWEWSLNNVQVSGFGLAGLKLDRCYRGVLNSFGCYASGQKGAEAAIYITSTLTTDRSSNIIFMGGQVQDTPVGIPGVRIDSAVGCSFVGFTFQSNGYGIEILGATSCTFRDCYMEDLDREVRLSFGYNQQPCSQIRFDNVVFARDTYTYPILLEGDEYTIFDNCRGGGSKTLKVSANLSSKLSKIINCYRITY